MLRGRLCRVPPLRAASWGTRAAHERAHAGAARAAAYRDMARSPASRSLFLRLYRRRRAALASGEALPSPWQRAGLFALFADGAWPECARALRELLRDCHEDDGEAVSVGVRAMLRAGAAHRARDLVAWARQHRPAWLAHPEFVDAAVETLLQTSAHQDLLPALERLVGQGGGGVSLSAATVDALLTRCRTDLDVARARSLLAIFRSASGHDAADAPSVLARHVVDAARDGDPLWFARVRLLAFARAIGAAGDSVVGASLRAAAAAAAQGLADPPKVCDAARRALRELRWSGAAASATALEQGLDDLAAALQGSAWDPSCTESRRLAAELHRLGPVAGTRQDVDRLDAAVTRLAGPGWRNQATVRGPAPVPPLRTHASEARLRLAEEAWRAAVLEAGPDAGLQRFHEALFPVLAAALDAGQADGAPDHSASVWAALRACPSTGAAQQLANQMLRCRTDPPFAFPSRGRHGAWVPATAWRDGALRWLASPGTAGRDSAAGRHAAAVEDVIEALGLLAGGHGDAQVEADDPMLALAVARARRGTMDRLASQLVALARRDAEAVGEEGGRTASPRALLTPHRSAVSRACVAAHRDGFDASALALARACAAHGVALHGAALYAAVAAAEVGEDVGASSKLLASSLRRGSVPHANALAAFLRTAAREWPPGSLHALAEATAAWASTSAKAAASRRGTLRRAATLVEAPPAPRDDPAPFMRVADELGARLADPHARTVHRALLQAGACCGAADEVIAAVARLGGAHTGRDAALDAAVAGFEDRVATAGGDAGGGETSHHGAQRSASTHPSSPSQHAFSPTAQWTVLGAREVRQCNSCWARRFACPCGPPQAFARRKQVWTARIGPSTAGAAWWRR